MAVTSHNFSHYKLPLQIPRTASVISVYRPASPTRPLCFTTLIILRVSTFTSRRACFRCSLFFAPASCADTSRAVGHPPHVSAGVLSVLLTRRTSTALFDSHLKLLMGIEPMTPSLPRTCSTPEPQQQDKYMA